MYHFYYFCTTFIGCFFIFVPLLFLTKCHFCTTFMGFFWRLWCSWCSRGAVWETKVHQKRQKRGYKCGTKIDANLKNVQKSLKNGQKMAKIGYFFIFVPLLSFLYHIYRYILVQLVQFTFHTYSKKCIFYKKFYEKKCTNCTNVFVVQKSTFRI